MSDYSDYFGDEFKKRWDAWIKEYERLKKLSEPRPHYKPGDPEYNRLLDGEREVPSEEDLLKLNEELIRAISFVQRPLMKPMGTTGA